MLLSSKMPSTLGLALTRLDEQSAKAALQSNTEATPGITEATQLASRLRFEMLQAPWLSDRLRIFNLLNNALGVSLLAVGWVCSEAEVAARHDMLVAQFRAFRLGLGCPETPQSLRPSSRVAEGFWLLRPGTPTL